GVANEGGVGVHRLTDLLETRGEQAAVVSGNDTGARECLGPRHADRDVVVDEAAIDGKGLAVAEHLGIGLGGESTGPEAGHISAAVPGSTAALRPTASPCPDRRGRTATCARRRGGRP